MIRRFITIGLVTSAVLGWLFFIRTHPAKSDPGVQVVGHVLLPSDEYGPTDVWVLSGPNGYVWVARGRGCVSISK